MVKNMEKVSIIIEVELFLRDNGIKIENMASASTVTLMDRSTKATGLTAKNTAKVPITIKVAIST